MFQFWCFRFSLPLFGRKKWGWGPAKGEGVGREGEMGVS